MRIHLIAPAGPPEPARIDAVLADLRAEGHDVVLGEHSRRVFGHLAGTDEERAQDLMRALCDEEADLVWALRGGFGCLRLLSQLDWNRLEKVSRRPVLLGYSDLTSLQNILCLRLGWPCWHGPMAATEGRHPEDTLSRASLNALFTWIESGEAKMAAQYTGQCWSLVDPGLAPSASRARLRIDYQGFQQEILLPEEQIAGSASIEAPLLGGNLSVLGSLCGVPGAQAVPHMLLLEDHGEYPFRLDRHFAQLEASGWTDKTLAVLLGPFLNCDEPDAAKSTFTVSELVDHYFGKRGIPVIQGPPFGHTAPRICLPLGAAGCRLDLR